MKKPAVQPAIYKKVVKFLTSGGSARMLGTVIGSLDEKTIAVYVDHLKATDPALYKKAGLGKAAKPEPEDDDEDPTADLEDIDDPTADLGEDDPPPPPREKTQVKEKTGKKEKTAGLDSLFDGKDTPAAKEGNAVVTEASEGMMIIDGKEYPMKFRLRGANGLDTELEVFSKSPRWGVIVRIPVPSDIRKILLPGGEVEVDLLVLKRDSDGMTTLNGKKYSNSKLIAAAELQEDD